MRIDEALVSRLLARHAPQLAVLPIIALRGGWDNRSFRIGDDLVARLPSAKRYVAGTEKEQKVLPILSAHLHLQIPQVVAAFGAGPDFPWPWTILAWIEGETAQGVNGADQVALARDIARFLRALHTVDPAKGPLPGAHSLARGGSLAFYDGEMRRALSRLGSRAAGAATIWDWALASAFAGPVVWLHGDLHPGNLLVRDSRLSAVIDWGLAAVGDPAADLAIAWRWFSAEANRAFRNAMPMSPEAWLRGAGWAAWKAAIVLAGLPGTDQRERPWAAATLDRLVADEALNSP